VNLTIAEDSRRLVDGEWVDGPTTYWDIVCFGPQAEHIITSLAKGARVIAIGSFRTRTWTAADGQERTTLEILAEEIGPSVRGATTEVTKTGT
jgi:single-strand DNA-binding protein